MKRSESPLNFLAILVGFVMLLTNFLPFIVIGSVLLVAGLFAPFYQKSFRVDANGMRSIKEAVIADNDPSQIKTSSEIVALVSATQDNTRRQAELIDAVQNTNDRLKELVQTLVSHNREEISSDTSSESTLASAAQKKERGEEVVEPDGSSITEPDSQTALQIPQPQMSLDEWFGMFSDLGDVAGKNLPAFPDIAVKNLPALPIIYQMLDAIRKAPSLSDISLGQDDLLAAITVLQGTASIFPETVVPQIRGDIATLATATISKNVSLTSEGILRASAAVDRFLVAPDLSVAAHKLLAELKKTVLSGTNQQGNTEQEKRSDSGMSSPDDRGHLANSA